MKKIFFIILFIFTVIPSGVSYAAESTALKVTPVIIPLQLSPNQTISKDIVIENISSVPQPLRAVFSDFETTGEDGGYNIQETAKNPLLSWSSVSPRELLIPAHSKATVRLEIRTPNKIPVGGYFGMLFFEPVPEPSRIAQSTQVIARIGVLLLGSVGVQDKRQLSVLTFDPPFLNNSGDIKTILRVKNTGLEYITAKPILTVTPLFATSSKTIWEDKVVFPGNVRRWEKTIQLPNWNIYHLTMAVSKGNGKYITEERTVIVFPYLPILLILFVVVLLLLVIFKRKQIQKALKIVLFNK